MPPNVILLSHVQGGAKNRIGRALSEVGMVVRQMNFEEATEEFDYVLDQAQAVLVVIEFQSPDLDRDLAIPKIVDYHRRKIKPPILLIIEKYISVPDELLGFPRITFNKQIADSDVLIVVERVLQLLRESEAKAPLGMEELMVEAQLQIPRLEMIIEEPKTLEMIGLILAAITTIAGVALSIPRVLARFSLAPQWLFIGPILFIAGGLLTIYLYARRPRERRRMAIAKMLHSELTKVVNEINSSRESRKTRVTING